MRRLFILTIYLMLVIYALIHLVFFYRDDGMLLSVLSMNADPMLLMMFNLLGLFPVAYLLIALKTMNLTPKDFIPLGLGFMLGGFAITPLFIYKKDHIKPNKPWVKYASIFGLVGTVLVMIYGLIYGNIQVYLDAFMNDSFIHIMTIDFLFLVILSVMVLKPVSKFYYLGFIPLIGLYIGVLIHERI